MWEPGMLKAGKRRREIIGGALAVAPDFGREIVLNLGK